MRRISSRPIVPAALVLALHAAAASPATAQGLHLSPDVPRALVGDEVTFTLRAQLRPGQELLDLVPRNLLPPPSGVRVLAVDSLQPGGEDRFTGKVKMVFFRIGPQPVPTFSLIFRPGPGELPDTMVHVPVAMEIASIVPAGNPALKDIRPLQIIGGPIWAPLALLSALIGGGFFYLWWRTRRLDRPTKRPVAATREAGPFERALTQLAVLEQRARASGNGAVPLCGDVAAVLRDCLVAAGVVSHAALTTPETALALPPTLGNEGGRERLFLLLADADLVKFARVRPDLPAALAHLERARQLLHSWKRGVVPEGEAETPSRRAAESPS